MNSKVLRKANLVVAGVVVAVGASVTGLVLSGGSPAHPTRSAQRAHDPVQPATKAAGSADSTTAPPVTSATLAQAPASVPASTDPSTTVVPTTTAPAVPQCQWSNFTVKVTSDYTSGATVPFDVTATNSGPACTDAGQGGCDCWGAYVEDAAGNTVWIEGAPEPPTSSIKVTSPPQVLPAGWSVTRPMSWGENTCTYQSCSQARSATPPNSYKVFGEWAFHVQAAQNAIVSAPLSITIE